MNEAGRRTVVVDFSAEDRPDLSDVDFDSLDVAIVHIPLPSFGSSNSHIDLCSDLLDASWAMEKLACHAGHVEMTMSEGYYKPNVIATLHHPRPGLREALVDCALVFLNDDADASEELRLQDLRGQIADYEDTLHTLTPLVPELVDNYLANLMAAYGELRSESPEYYADQIRAFPERRVGYFRSAYSTRIGGDCYASHDGWLLGVDIDVDDFFSRSGQHYRLEEFSRGELFMLPSGTLVHCDCQLIAFPASRFLQSLVCASLLAQESEDEYLSDLYSWPHDATTPKGLRNDPDAWRQSFLAVRRAEYFVHETGTLMFVNDGKHRHFLYDTQVLNLNAAKAVRDEAASMLDTLSAAAGLSESLDLDWASLSDDRFEELCYDIIYAHPQYDSGTIRKLGKSRSRDGGRDIEVRETRRWQGGTPRKWIFQCKLVTNGSSLGASRLVDVGDMLDHYGAQGFGVMTSVLIDATLYDKLDGVCCKRAVAQNHYSVLELERAVARHPNIRKRYFK